MKQNTATSLNEVLHSQYGPMLTPEIVAGVLHRDHDAFDQWLRKSKEPAAQALRDVKKKLGRRIYFVTAEVAAILSGEEASI